MLVANGTSNTATGIPGIFVSSTDQLNAGSFYQTSSRIFKTNISKFKKTATSILNNVNIVEFYYKNDLTTPHIGFIAEDTPVELSTSAQNKMDTNSTVGVLIKAVQELEARLKKLENND